MSPDPVPGDMTDPQTLDLYTYVHNDPINLMDPTGLRVDCGPGPSGCELFGCPPPILIPVPCGGGGSDNGGGFPIPPDNAPTPPNLHNTGLGQGSPNPFNGETNGIPNGMQIPSLGLPGIFLPDDPGCDFGGCDFHNGLHHYSDPTLFPGLHYAAFLIRVFAYGRQEEAKAIRTMYGDPVPQRVAYTGCVVMDVLPITFSKAEEHLGEHAAKETVKMFAPALLPLAEAAILLKTGVDVGRAAVKCASPSGQ